MSRGDCAVVGFALVIAAPSLGLAQSTGSRRPDPPKWEISIQAGGALPGLPQQGLGTPPDQNPLFTTVNGRLSRTVPSYFFAYGGSLLNQVLTQAQTPARLTTADSSVFAPGTNFANSWAIGARVSRAINPRFAFEGSFDYTRSRLEIANTVAPALQATAASYVSAWNALLAVDPVTFQNVAVSATSTVNAAPSNYQLISTGSLIINILTKRRNTPYALLGAGAMYHGGEVPSFTLAGHIQTLLNGTAPIDETDTMTLRYDVDRTVWTVTVGAGWKHMITERWGLRGEVREQLSGTPMSSRVTATPGPLLTSTAAAQGAGATDKFIAVQFSNIAGSSTISSLHGSLASQEMFHWTGMENRFSATGGLFWRF